MKDTTFIPVYQPTLSDIEKINVNECLESNWISSKGIFVSRFEETFAAYTGASHVTTVSNGTVALYLALLTLNLSPGDEVIVPTFTYVASVNVILQIGAKPVFVDSLPTTWQMDPEDVRRKITTKTKAIMAVHLYGHPCEMSQLKTICDDFNLLLIEDCAEAFGSLYKDQHVGTFGDAATFSFFGNKTITTGEGGMLVLKSEEHHALACTLKNQGVSKKVMYWHDMIGYNYRMTNICAAIGTAQLERADEILAKKRQIAMFYKEHLNNLPLTTHEETVNVKHSFWMCSILSEAAQHRDPLREHLDTHAIETRPTFYPAHLMPMYDKTTEHHPVAEFLGLRGINLPSWPGLTEEHLSRITRTIKHYFEGLSA